MSSKTGMHVITYIVTILYIMNYCRSKEYDVDINFISKIFFKIDTYLWILLTKVPLVNG